MRQLNFARMLMAILIFAGLMSSQSVLAKGSELKFDSAVQAVSQTSASEGTVTIITNGFEVPIIVNGDTEIHVAGSEGALDELDVGDVIRVNAFFAAEGITAESIAVMAMAEAHFRLHGEVSEVEQDAVTTDADTLTRIRLLGVDVYVGSSTRITQRGVGLGNAVPAENLTAGSQVDVHGYYDDMLIAQRIHVGSRLLGQIELDGEATAVSDTQLTVTLDDGGEVTVIIDADTEIGGMLEEGVYIEVEGMLNADLEVVATEIVVDTDGDGDADDDNGRPDIELPGVVTSRFSAMLEAVEADSSLSGSVKLDFPPIEKTIEIKVTGADAGTEMSVHLLASDTVIDLGTVVADSEGKIDAELDYSADAIALLPTDIGPGDIDEIELSIDGTVVLRGSF